MILWQIFPLSLLISSLLMLITQGINPFLIISNIFVIDSFGVCLSLIPLFSLSSLVILMHNELNKENILLVTLSCLFSVLCFNCNNIIAFFVFYETSIILLLFSLFIGSPYSERSLAGWYFLGYLVFGGVPLLVICIYTYVGCTSILINYNNDALNYLFFLLFITKVPLFPFHSWLPIVHAEANSYVSIMLSGYVMKLGLVGIIRLFNLSGEVIMVYCLLFFFASCFFFISCFLELDNKRWLAFLSLGHISVGIVGVLSIPSNEEFLLGSFSLGHALSVTFLFYFFYIQSSSVGSRNWIVLINNNNTSMVWLIALGCLSLIAFPPSILFFNEVFIFLSSSSITSLLSIFYLYIFLSVLGPICVLSLVVSRLNVSIQTLIPQVSFIILICSIFIFYLYFIII
uniref:NADH-ubiquinone oxidoreductase chain 4 n=1 Tax=Gyrodactylus sp. FY-2015 TaxID=1678844 RepID=A0A7R5WF61_9PLAT|nr:NADH dehydrogenase subunit 4 [Gyrodactylus sp. FY-2015]